MAGQVDLNVGVDYVPQNRVMETRRVQTIRHPPSNGATFSQSDPYMMFRIQNTGNTFLDPSKTRLNFKYKLTNMTGTGASTDASLQNGYGTAYASNAGAYCARLTSLGAAGFVKKLELRVGGVLIEQIDSYPEICKMFQNAQVRQKTLQGLMTCTEGLLADGAQLGQIVGSPGSCPAITTRGTENLGTNYPPMGVYLNSGFTQPPSGFLTFGASHPILSAVIGAGSDKYVPLAFFRSPLEVYVFLQDDVKKVIYAIGDEDRTSAGGTNWSQLQRVYTSCTYELSDVNLETGLCVFNEDSMDLIRSQIDESMMISWSGNQVAGISQTANSIKGNTTIIVPSCNYRNLKALFFIQTNPSPKGATDPSNQYGIGIKQVQYSIEGKLYPKIAMGSPEDSTSGANVGEATASFARYFLAAINRSAGDQQSGIIAKAPRQNVPFTASNPLNFGYANCSGMQALQAKQFDQGLHGFIIAETLSGKGIVPNKEYPIFAQMTFATGYNFCDWERPNQSRTTFGVDTSRAMVTMVLNRWASRVKDWEDPIQYTHVPIFEVNYNLDLNTGIMSRDI
jgi:hypothetical protein